MRTVSTTIDGVQQFDSLDHAIAAMRGEARPLYCYGCSTFLAVARRFGTTSSLMRFAMNGDGDKKLVRESLPAVIRCPRSDCRTEREIGLGELARIEQFPNRTPLPI